MPWSIAAAATLSPTPSATRTMLAAGASRPLAYDPGTDDHATRSPAANPFTSDAADSTSPAPSRPATNGSGRG